MSKKSSSKNTDSSRARAASESMTETNHIVLPSHANALGSLFGGVLMSWIDITAAICAQKHARKIAVTASIDALSFLAPIHVGDMVNLRARVIYTGRTSMVVLVEVMSERPQSGTRQRCVTAYLNFVAFDEARRPTPVAPLLIENKDDQRLFDWAAKRRSTLIKQLQEMPTPKS